VPSGFVLATVRAASFGKMGRMVSRLPASSSGRRYAPDRSSSASLDSIRHVDERSREGFGIGRRNETDNPIRNRQVTTVRPQQFLGAIGRVPLYQVEPDNVIRAREV